MKRAKSSVWALSLLMAILMTLTVLAGGVALATDPHALEEDYASMHSSVAKTDIAGVYKVTMSVRVKQTPVNPPALVTLVLDGTASMNGQDGRSTDHSLSRDSIVRQAAISALNTLMGDDNENKERTYVNVIMFGSYGDRAISLTEWATRSTKGPGDFSGYTISANWIVGGIKYALPGYDYTGAAWPGETLEFDNTPTQGGTTFVPLLNSAGTKMNPVLAGLFDIPVSYSGSDATTATTISTAYSYGNWQLTTQTRLRFPLSNSGTWINPGIVMAYSNLAAEIANQKLKVTDKEFEAMKKTVLIMADGDDSLNISSQSYAAAIRAPYSEDPAEKVMVNTYITNGTAGQGNYTASTPAQSEGLGAEIWSLVVDAGTKGANWVSTYGTMPTLEKHLAGMTIDIPNQHEANAFETILTGGVFNDYETYFNSVLTSTPTSAHQERFRRVNNLTDAVNFFDAFATDAMASGGTEKATADLVMSQYYDVCQVPGKPFLETWSTEAGKKPTASYSNGKIDWNLDRPEDGVVYLVFYVKIADGLDPSMSYPIFSSATLHYTMSALTGSGMSYSLTFPMPYVSPGGEITQGEETSASLDESAAAESASGNKTGAEGHQQNRASTKNMQSSLGYNYNVAPIVNKLRALTALNGRARVAVDVENGKQMLYQWQWLNEEAGPDAWEDIFGATASQYTLGSQFKAGKTYKVRCRITNPAGALYYTEWIEVTATAAKSGGTLQSK